MHRIFPGDGWLAVLDIRNSAPNHCPSRLLVQEALILIILCILCIDVQYSCSRQAINFRCIALELSALSARRGRAYLGETVKK